MIKTNLINTALVIFSTVGCLLLLELGTHLLYDSRLYSAYRFRMSRPEPYAEAKYPVEELIEEAVMKSTGITEIKEKGLVYHNDRTGKYINVVDNFRYTTDTPKKFSSKVYVFGGSTVFCSEVPDKFTITSYLQRKLNKVFPGKYKVINCGVGSVNTLQQLARLKTIKLAPKDIVIFYGGVNEEALFLTGRINGWFSMGEPYPPYIPNPKPSFFRSLIETLYTKLYWRSLFVNLFLNPNTYQINNIPTYLQDTTIVNSLKKKLFRSYKNSIYEASTYCKDNKAVFINFLQPNIVTRKENTDYEENIPKKHLISVSAPFALKICYETLRIAIDTLAKSEIKTYDLTAVFDHTQDNYYLDQYHITEKGNEIIASNIFNIIKDK